MNENRQWKIYGPWFSLSASVVTAAHRAAWRSWGCSTKMTRDAGRVRDDRERKALGGGQGEFDGVRETLDELNFI